MTTAFSFASWNVEHFRQDANRVNRVVIFLRDSDPGIFALYEVEGSEVFGALTTLMPGYGFHITEGPQTQEVLVGVRSGITAFFTQKIESGARRMRRYGTIAPSLERVTKGPELLVSFVIAII